MAKPPKLRNAVIYARVSSKEQAEGYSIDAQLRELRDYAERQGFTVSSEFVDIETAKASGRKQFKVMVDSISKSQVGAIVVEKTDRLYRNFKDYVVLDDLKVDLHLVKEHEVISQDSRSHAKLTHRIKVVMAANYCDNLSEEASKGMREKARQGIYPSIAPIGYLNQDKAIVVDPVKGPIIRRLFEVYAEGTQSLLQLSRLAFQLGLKTRKGNRVNKASIAWLLQNPIYYGLIRWNKEEFVGFHDPIVTKNLFDKVQDVLHGKKPRDHSYRNLDFTYGGLLSCGHCGCQMTAERKKEGRYIYYHCTGNRGRCPGMKVINESAITEQLAELFTGLLIPDSVMPRLKEKLRSMFSEESEAMSFHSRRLAAEEIRLKGRLESLAVSRIDNEITGETYKELKVKWEKELVDTRLLIAEQRTRKRPLFDDAIALIELAKNAPYRFKQALTAEKKKLLIFMGSNFSVLDGTVHIQLQKPFDLIAKAVDTCPENAESAIWWSVLDEVRSAVTAA